MIIGRRKSANVRKELEKWLRQEAERRGQELGAVEITEVRPKGHPAVLEAVIELGGPPAEGDEIEMPDSDGADPAADRLAALAERDDSQ